jgi:hypothetical protein
MAEYLAEVHMMEKFFDRFEVCCAPHLDNRDANHLSWIASSRAPASPDVNIEKLSKPSVKPAESTSEDIEDDLMAIDEPDQERAYDWMQQIKMFLENHLLLDDNAQVDHIARKSSMYHLIDGILFQ